jgi:hypothetical protein
MPHPYNHSAAATATAIHNNTRPKKKKNPIQDSRSNNTGSSNSIGRNTHITKERKNMRQKS